MDSLHHGQRGHGDEEAGVHGRFLPAVGIRQKRFGHPKKRQNDFHSIAAKYLWGSQKIQKIKEPFKHYFTYVANYFINEDFDINIMDSRTYKKALIQLRKEHLDETHFTREKLLLMRNFLGGLTNLKVIELYKKIKKNERR